MNDKGWGGGHIHPHSSPEGEVSETLNGQGSKFSSSCFLVRQCPFTGMVFQTSQIHSTEKYTCRTRIRKPLIKSLGNVFVVVVAFNPTE